MKLYFISLNEIKQWFSHDLQNLSTFSHPQLAQHGGVAISLPEDISCCDIPTFHEKPFDSK